MIQIKLPPMLELSAKTGACVPPIFADAARTHAKCRFKDWETGASLMQWKTGKSVDMCINDFRLQKSVMLEAYSRKDVFVFHFMLKGSAVLCFPDREQVRLQAGEFNLFLMPQGSSAFVKMARGKHKSCHIFLKPEDVKEMGERYEPVRELVAAFEQGERQMRSGRIFVPISPEMGELLCRLEWDEAPPDLQFKSIYKEVFDLFSAYGDAVQGFLNRMRVNKNEDDTIALIHQFICEHYHCAEEVSIPSLARWGSIGITNLKIKFAKKYSIPIHHFITTMRLQDAEWRLCNSSDCAQDIAYDVGYQSAAAFHSAFVKAYGMTPREYRNLHQKGRHVSDI